MRRRREVARRLSQKRGRVMSPAAGPSRKHFVGETEASMDEHKEAFVIMPFDAEFTEVYREFIFPILTEVGYTVSRADDLFGQKSILSDIVQCIASSDLIIADLTGLNANVFYELGIAHGLRKPVVLLTQSLDELPFDLQSYRVIIYDTHFARIQSARESLRQTVLGAFQGKLEFGSPVSDFSDSLPRLASRSPVTQSGSATAQEDEDEAEPGWLDHIVELEDGFRQLVENLGKVATTTRAIGEKTGSYAKRLDTAKATLGTQQASAMRHIANAYSKELDEYGQELSSANDEYERIARATQDSIEYILANAHLNTDKDREALNSLVATLGNVEGSAAGALDGFSSMRQSLKATEGIERSMTRAARVVGSELARFIANVEKTIASVHRGVEVGSRRLEPMGDASDPPQ